jgi:hypothetical protein
MNIDFVIILKQKHLHLSPILFLLHESNNSNKLKLVGVFHNTSTHEQLTLAKRLRNSKDLNNYI